MIHMTVNARWQCLGKKSEVHILAPDDASKGAPVKVLWALHGMGDDCTGWLRRSNIEELAENFGVCVVLPDGDLSFYVDMAGGADYRSWIAQELPERLGALLPLSRQPAENCIAGISMGGYGAFHIAMSNPEKYGVAASLSGPMRIAWINRILADPALAAVAASGSTTATQEAVAKLEAEEGIPPLLTHSLLEMAGERTVRLFQGMFGEQAALEGGRLDLFHLAKGLPGSGHPLKLLAYCGEEDYHYASNIQFREYARELGLDYHLTTGSGAHLWSYWNRVIPLMMQRLYGLY